MTSVVVADLFEVFSTYSFSLLSSNASMSSPRFQVAHVTFDGVKCGGSGFEVTLAHSTLATTDTTTYLGLQVPNNSALCRFCLVWACQVSVSTIPPRGPTCIHRGRLNTTAVVEGQHCASVNPTNTPSDHEKINITSSSTIT